MDASIKQSFWFDDTLSELGRDAMWVFLWLLSNASDAGVTTIHRKRMARELQMEWPEIDKGLEALASPPKPFKGLVAKMDGSVFVRGYIRHNIGNGSPQCLKNNRAKKVRRLLDAMPLEQRAIVLADYPWLTLVEVDRSPSKPFQALPTPPSPSKPSEGPERRGEKREYSPKGESEGEPGADWAEVAAVLTAYEAASGLRRGAGGWIADPLVRQLVADRLAEIDGDVPGMIATIERKTDELKNGDEKWRRLLAPTFIFGARGFHEAYALSGVGEEKKTSWTTEDLIGGR